MNINISIYLLDTVVLIYFNRRQIYTKSYCFRDKTIFRQTISCSKMRALTSSRCDSYQGDWWRFFLNFFKFCFYISKTFLLSNTQREEVESKSHTRL